MNKFLEKIMIWFNKNLNKLFIYIILSYLMGIGN